MLCTTTEGTEPGVALPLALAPALTLVKKLRSGGRPVSIHVTKLGLDTGAVTGGPTVQVVSVSVLPAQRDLIEPIRREPRLQIMRDGRPPSGRHAVGELTGHGLLEAQVCNGVDTGGQVGVEGAPERLFGGAGGALGGGGGLSEGHIISLRSGRCLIVQGAD